MATSEKIAVITGAGSGIGRATALALHADGFSVVLAGRRQAMLEETAALANATPPRMLVVPTDVTDPASIASLFDTVKSTYGRIDLLFNNAGTSTAQYPDRRPDVRAMVECRRDQPDRLVPLRAARVPHDEAPAAARRPYHQQRFGVGACAAAELDALCRDQACADRSDAVTVAGWTRIRHRLRPDRHRQRGNNAQRGHRTRPLAGQRKSRGRSAHRRVRRRARCRLHGQPLTGSERPIHDRDGNKDALYRPRLIGRTTL